MLLHKKWRVGQGVNRIQNHHPLVRCFNEFFEKTQREDGRISSTARIPLPFVVESRPEVFLLSFIGTSQKVLYVILKAPAKKVAETTKVIFEDV